MSLARQITAIGDATSGSVARPLPTALSTPRPAVRPQQKKGRKNWARLMLGGLGWALVVALSLFTVQRNTLVQTELAAVASLKSDLAREERLIQERSTKLADASSLTKVTEWALAHGMVQPQHVKTVAADPTAVVTAQEPAPVQVAAEPRGFFGAVRSYFTRMTAGLPTPGR